MLQPLTQRQRQAFDFIVEHITSKGYPPTLREIGQRMGIRSTNGVNDHLKALIRKGWIVRSDLKSRALRPTPEATQGRCLFCGHNPHAIEHAP